MKQISVLFSIILSTAVASNSNNGDDGSKSNQQHKQTSSRRRFIELREEEHEIGYLLGLTLHDPPLYSEKSTYQDIEIFESDHFGKVFVLDECLQLTERDAANYNEMLAHVPIMEYYGKQGGQTYPEGMQEGTGTESQDNISGRSNSRSHEQLNVLVLGGGDGYVVSEVLKHPIVKNVDHCELDEKVIQVSETFFPWAKDLWKTRSSSSEVNGQRKKEGTVHLYVEDGAKFLEKKASSLSSTTIATQSNDAYHIIIQDSSDPFVMESNGEITTLPSHVLYTRDHFENIYKILKKTNGVLIFQAETYNIPSNLVEIRKWRELLMDIGFQHVRYGSISTPTYSTGQIGFFVAHALSLDDDEEERDENACSNRQTDKGNKGSGAFCLNEQERGDFLDYEAMNVYFKSVNFSTQYYHPPIHRGAFDLPLWVHQYINGLKR